MVVSRSTTPSRIITTGPATERRWRLGGYGCWYRGGRLHRASHSSPPALLRDMAVAPRRIQIRKAVFPTEWVAAVHRADRGRRTLENLDQADHDQQAGARCVRIGSRPCCRAGTEIPGSTGWLAPSDPRLATAHAVKSWRDLSNQAQPAKQQEGADTDEDQRPYSMSAEIPDVQRVQQEDHAQADEDHCSHRNFAYIHPLAGAKGRPQPERIGRRLSQLYGPGGADGIDNLIEVKPCQSPVQIPSQRFHFRC